ncbi:MAG: tyrosine decarboxylase MfnA [Promethearchaeota archaeon]
MKLEENGIKQGAVIELLERITEKDKKYASGHILGSMCTFPHEFSTRLASMFPEKNLGDPGLFPGTARLEEDCIQMMGDMLGCEKVVGNITTGGSEANIIAMRVAKKMKAIGHPEVIIPETAHASFHKAADFMGFTLKELKIDADFQIDLGDLERAITSNTLAVVGIAGTTSLGLVDPIEEMGKIIEERDSDIFFHVDAAFGGFVLPFLVELGHDIPKYDFTVNAVHSMTCDPHKMGMNLIPSGGFMLREEIYRDGLGFDIPYLAGGAFKHFNIMGTRPGSVVIACWGLMKHLGKNGLRKVVNTCWENTLYFRDRIRELDKYIDVAAEPLMNVIGIVSVTHVSIARIDATLKENGWYLGLFKDMTPPLVRVVLMPHITRETIDDFFDVFERVLKDLNSTPQVY